MTLSPGTLLNNRYRILSTLGQGGMGAVYHAIDENLGVAVAVKENLFLTDEYARQFQREASILAGLRHTNLPRVGDYFTFQGQGQYLIMDYIDGEDLRMRLERLKQLPEKEVVIIGVLICEALAYLHTRRPAVVHRDIKPGNIKITPEGEIILVDFGLAKVMSGGQATTTGARAMTPGYSPPEQYGTARTDPRSDIYSLGATLYAALTGVIPEDGLARATGKVELTPIRSLLPKVNRRLATALEKALEVEPDQRFQTAEAFRDALQESTDIPALANLGRITVPPPPPVIEDPPDPPQEAAVESPEPPAPVEVQQPAALPVNTGRLHFGSCLLSLSLIVLALAGLAGLIFLRPDLPIAFIQQYLPGALPTRTPTLATDPPPESTLLPSGTPASPVIVETVQPVQPTQLPTQTPTISETPTQIGGGTGQLAFSSNRTGTFQVWLMYSDGTRLLELTNLPNGACQPSWSPDGKKLAFVSPCHPINDAFPGGRIYTMNSDGTNIQPLDMPVNLEGDFYPSWSPDGKAILYTSIQGKLPQIFKFTLADNTTRNLSNSKAYDFNAIWAPNGKQIAFVRQTLVNQIWLMDSDGQNQVQFNYSDPSLFSQGPAWTPDSQVILFSQVKGNQPIPWLMAQRLRDQGTNLEFKVPPTGQDIGPIGGVSISPDGFLIAFESWPDGKNHDIFLMTLNGADRTPLTSDPGYDFSPAWRPKVTTP
jgi:eukaryotic-like serine/threonine-protein kinase